MSADTDSGIEFISPFDVVFTPPSGVPISIPHVDRLVYDEQVSTVDFGGDGDLYITAVVPSIARPQATVTTLAVAVMNQIPTGGLPGVLTWIAGDSLNGPAPGGGGIRYVLSRAVFLRRPVNVPYYKQSDTAYVFAASSADGKTSPLSAGPV